MVSKNRLRLRHIGVAGACGETDVRIRSSDRGLIKESNYDYSTLPYQNLRAMRTPQNAQLSLAHKCRINAVPTYLQAYKSTPLINIGYIS